MRSPQITVVLPAKDAAPYIATTLETLIRQFDQPSALKLVAIDDGSTDGTGEIMRLYADRFPNAEVLRNERPVGLATARNQGLDRVDTEAFCFIDGDDWMQPGRLPVLVDRLRDLDVDFLRTDHVRVTSKARTLVRAPHAWRDRVARPQDAILPVDDTTMVDYPYAWAGIFHGRLIERGLASFDDGLFTAEDRPWIWRLHLRAESFSVVDAPALLYRRGLATSLSQVRDRRQLDFVPALSAVLDAVQQDAETERFLPKAVWSVLALSSHHLVRARRMESALRRDMRSSITDLLTRLPEDEAKGALARFDGPRRRVLAKVLREAGTAA